MVSCRLCHHVSNIFLRLINCGVSRIPSNQLQLYFLQHKTFLLMDESYYGFDPLIPSSLAHNAQPGTNKGGRDSIVWTYSPSRTSRPLPHLLPSLSDTSTAKEPVVPKESACGSCPECIRKNELLWGFDPPCDVLLRAQSDGQGDRQRDTTSTGTRATCTPAPPAGLSSGKASARR